jgi:hypothetical protein
MKVSKNYNLRVKFPDLAKEWHLRKNGDLTPEDVTHNTQKKVWWRCPKGHQWQASIYLRVKGSGCPHCNGRRVTQSYNLQKLKPWLSKQWHPTKNGNLTPADVTPYSNKKVWWICPQGHEWQTWVNHRSKGNGCPYCSGHRASDTNNLEVVNPGLSKEWHPTRNKDLAPVDVTPYSNKKVWWFCAQGHEWQAWVHQRSKGRGCPYCSGRKASDTNNLEVLNPELSKEWHPTRNKELTPRDVTPYSNKKVWWICKKGHEYEMIIGQRSRWRGCPSCFERKPPKNGFKKGNVPKRFKGFYTPRIKNWDGQCRVVTTLEKKLKTKGKKGKIIECRRVTNYARYVYGLDRIPEGFVIWHLDGDPLNNDIENLECISREEAYKRMYERKKILKNK